MGKCVIQSCACSTTLKNCPGDSPSFHKIPKDHALRRKWLDAINRSDNFSVNSSVVCGHHFTNDCFYHPLSEQLMPSVSYKRKLSKDAFPTLFLISQETSWEKEKLPGKKDLNTYRFSFLIVFEES